MCEHVIHYIFSHYRGQLSPENIGKALNTTQIAAAEYYSWFYDKVDFYAKIK